MTTDPELLTADIPQPNAFDILIRFWPLIVALVLGAGILGESRYRLSNLESKIVHLEKHSNDKFSELAQELKDERRELMKVNRELRIGLGKMQLSMARICAKLDVECN